jgi:hypothetical protein
MKLIDKDTLVAEIKRRKELVSDPILSGNDLMIGERNAYFNLLSFIDSMQEEPDEIVDKYLYGKEPELVDVDDLPNKDEEPISKDFEAALAECINQAQCAVVDPMAHAEIWKDELIKLAKSEEPVSEDLERFIYEHLWKGRMGEEITRPIYFGYDELLAVAQSIANWQKKKDDEMFSIVYMDGFEEGKKLMKQQMMNGAFVYEKKHDTAMVLASECLRNHGWFNREHDFNDLWQFICGVKELFTGEFKDSKKVKLIVIKED